MEKEYGVVIITPDSIRDGLQDRILADLLQEVDARILWKKYWQITNAETVEKIYPGLSEKFSCAAIIRTMLMTKCLFSVLEGNDIYTNLKKAKGHIKFHENFVEVTGLREKYKSWSVEDLAILDQDDQTFLQKVFEFRLHTSDDLPDTANACRLCMSKEDIESLRCTAPALYNEITNNDP